LAVFKGGVQEVGWKREKSAKRDLMAKFCGFLAFYF